MPVNGFPCHTLDLAAVFRPVRNRVLLTVKHVAGFLFLRRVESSYRTMRSDYVVTSRQVTPPLWIESNAQSLTSEVACQCKSCNRLNGRNRNEVTGHRGERVHGADRRQLLHLVERRHAGATASGSMVKLAHAEHSSLDVGY
jgi:hypothetical protein